MHVLTSLEEAPARPLRAAVLTRLSQMTEATTSPQRQLEACSALAAAAGWTFSPAADLYEDLDVSGWRTDVARPGLAALYRDLERYDVVVFWKLDRAFRSVPAFLTFLQTCEAAGVAVRSVMEPTLDTSTAVGRLIAYVLMAVAEMESENISTRVKSSQEFLVRNGRYRGGRITFGWATEAFTTDDGGQARRLVLHPVQSQLVRWMVDEVLQGSSLNNVARRLNDAGFHDPGELRGARTRYWRHDNVKNLLTNPILIGHARYRGSVVVDEAGVPIVQNEPLLDAWTWTRLQDELNGRNHRFRSGNETLLRGVVRCAECGGSMYAGGNRSYRCTRAHVDRRGCTGSSVSRAPLEAFVGEAIAHHLSPEALAEAADMLALEQRAIEHPLAPARAGIVAQLDRLEHDRADGLYDSDTARPRYLAQHRALTLTLEQLAEAVPPAAEVDQVLALDAYSNVRDLWENGTDLERRRLVLATVDHIKGKGVKGQRFAPAGRVQIVWRGATG
jgi:DNA invertase Pin-like site-specific DNA recombinase